MAAFAHYVLKGAGIIDPGWIRVCLGLFKEQQVNIRRLVLLQDMLETRSDNRNFSRMELQFALRNSAAKVANEEEMLFLRRLEGTLAQQRWQYQTLERL